MSKLPSIPDIPEQEQTPAVKILLVLVEQLLVRIQQQDEEIALLKDEINILKGQKKRPTFKGGNMDKKTESKRSSGKHKSKKRAGSKKRKKTQKLSIDLSRVIKPAESVPEGSRFKGYRDFVVQDLLINVHTTRYRLEHWVTPDNKKLKGQLPTSVAGRHFGPRLVSYILYQYHHCQTTQPLLLEQLREWGIDISSGQINQILIGAKESFHAEKEDLLSVALRASSYVTVDDSGARHQGKNGYVTHIGNDLFAWFKSTHSKSRINFLQLLRAGKPDYRLSQSALDYMQQQGLPKQALAPLTQHQGCRIANQGDWVEMLGNLLITKPRHRRIATEGALLGSVLHHGLCKDMTIVSDDAGQFNILAHALCWIHTERLIHKLIPLNEGHRQDIARVRDQVWCFYRALKEYKTQPCENQHKILEQRFDEIFTQQTCYQTLNQTLKRIHANKAELLLVLDRPNIPLHTNGSETDIRDYVKKRKVSGGTRSDAGRQCRDTFASLKKTCRKLDISFWHYLTHRLGVADQHIDPLPDIIMERAALATGY